MILHTDSKTCQCCWSVLKTLDFQSTLQMQHGSNNNLYPQGWLTMWRKGCTRAGAKSLHDPKVANTMWCGTGTRCKWTCAAYQPRHSCSLSSTPELNPARLKHASSCASISLTVQWGAAQNAQVRVTCESVSSAGPVLGSTQAPPAAAVGKHIRSNRSYVY